ncbi:tRNA pseudouridine(38-40) synthase TruA [Jonesiaceae bacterium BS-20]|uniref:tRNA pseudouridine synthase A n=1 Tax=Jonesiaceae bacterium BS-20 TaxID=3120821 RepID=A0AAU7DTF9_9MICO
MLRIRLELGYRGTAYYGWARQPDVVSVQETLEEALFRVTRFEGLHTVVAGRTDTGVHARRQVAHFDVPEALWLKTPGRSDRTPEATVLYKVNKILPTDIVLYDVRRAPEGFDARFSALDRTYKYRIADSIAVRDPLRTDSVLWHNFALDLNRMNEAALPLLGLHDFAAFCKARPGATTIRELKQLTWTRPQTGADAGLAVATIVSDAFCHNMVRALVGAVLVVGDGQKDVDWPTWMLNSRSRRHSSAVLPACGLTLQEVQYPADDQLAARAAAVRAMRMDEI